MSAIRLIVGLGNPGTQYEGTRHNAGAFFVRRLATQFGLTLAADRNALGDSARGTVAGHDLRLLIPETFMNESGRSVAAMARYYRIEPDAILIAHDELDIPPGESRFKYDGGHGGHNGLRDIIPRTGRPPRLLAIAHWHWPPGLSQKRVWLGTQQGLRL